MLLELNMNRKFFNRKSILVSMFFVNSIYAVNAYANCPSWKTQYDQLEMIAKNDSVVTVRHRGDFTTKFPENSLEAFRESYKNCRAAVETDVRFTKDKELVIFHDTHIGKMLEEGYNPLLDTGPNPELKSLTYSELKKKHLLTITREETTLIVPTVDDMLHDYLDHKGQSLIYLEVKDAAAIPETAKAIDRVAVRDPSLLKRVIIKFNMAEYPTPNHWTQMLNDSHIDVKIMANPVIAPMTAKRINDGPTIDRPPEHDFPDNASRAVAWWSKTPAQFVPNVEVLIKDSVDFIEKSWIENKLQASYDAPKNLSINNTRPYTMARFVSIIKSYNKPLGAFVPVPDYILWRPGLVSGVTVPNVIQNTKGNIDITKAYFQNNSACCYQLSNRLGRVEVFPGIYVTEYSDNRNILDWNRSIGVNVITADDTDTIDIYYAGTGALDKVAMPNPIPPKEEMHSTLSWDFNSEFNKIRFNSVNLKVDRGASQLFWGGTVCLYGNTVPDKNKLLDAWIYNCDANISYSKIMEKQVVEVPNAGALIQIFDKNSIASGNRKCLSMGEKDEYATWITDCTSQNESTLFKQNMDGGLQAIDFYTKKRYLEGVSYDRYLTMPYGHIIAVNEDKTTSWAEWAILPSD